MTNDIIGKILYRSTGHGIHNCIIIIIIIQCKEYYHIEGNFHRTECLQMAPNQNGNSWIKFSRMLATVVS